MNLSHAFLLITLVACTSLGDRKIAQSQDTKYYYGDVTMSSADGKIPYGKTLSLVKRIVNPFNSSIVEIVLQPSRDPRQKAKDIKTTLTRVGTSNVFLALDDGNTFEGKMLFEGSEWIWNQWSYDIKLRDGSRLDGSGLMDSEGIKTQKTFYKPDGVASVLLKENLKLIDLNEYYQRHKEIIGN